MKYFGNSIRDKVILALAASVLVPTLLLGVVYSSLIQKTLENKVIPLAQSNFDNISLNFNQQLKTYLSLVTEAASSQAVIDIAREEYGNNDRKKEKNVNACLSYLKTLDMKDRVIFPFSMVVVCDDNTLITPNVYSSGEVYRQLQERILQSDYYFRLRRTGSGSAIITVQDNLYTSNSSRQFYFAHNIINRNMESCGITLFCVDERYLASLLSGSDTEEFSSLYLTDENGNLILSGTDNRYPFGMVPLGGEDGKIRSGTETRIGKDGKRYLVMTNTMTLPGIGKSWNLTAVTRETDLMGEQRYITFAVIIVASMMILFGLLCMKYIDKSVLNPVLYYSEELRKVEGDRIRTDLEPKGTNEIRELGTDLQEMLDRIETSVRELENKEEEKRVLEARMLSAQINPHFIRNTLNSIRITAEMNQAYGVAEMIRVFARLIDYVFKRNAFSTVRAELAYLDDYITLQNLRYQDKFVFEKDVEEELLDLPVMSAVFQPIIENSIIHGFSGRKGTGTIRISGHRDGDMIEYRIEDDGIGMTPGDIRIEGNSLHGLANVQRRIELGYGDDSGLQIVGREPNGTVVIIRLSLSRNGEKHV